MTLLDDIKRAKTQGMPEDKIVQSLRDQGISYKDIANALAQSRIQDAVALPDENLDSQNTENSQEQYEAPMQIIPRIPQAPVQQPSAPEMEAPAPISENQDPYANYSYPGYGDYQPQGSEPSLLNEIAEQVVTEKLDDTRKQIEKISDIKSQIQARVESLDDRLKRIEKIIDLLQSSVLKKVGDYVTNVEDLKQELIETQKTFSSVASDIKHKKTHKK